MNLKSQTKKLIALFVGLALILPFNTFVANASNYDCPNCGANTYSLVGTDYYYRDSSPDTHSVYEQYHCKQCKKNFSICIDGNQSCDYQYVKGKMQCVKCHHKK